MLKGFKEFILRGNVIELAVAVVIGAAFTAIVNAIVWDPLGGGGLTRSTAAARASPIAVPPKPEKKPRLSTAWRTRSWSVVGGAATCGSPANATSPTRTLEGTLSRNFSTAACAAPSREGLTSVARIEPETSMTSTTAALSEGTSVFSCGRARAR